jgi:hypothetical protein
MRSALQPPSPLKLNMVCARPAFVKKMRNGVGTLLELKGWKRSRGSRLRGNIKRLGKESIAMLLPGFADRH